MELSTNQTDFQIGLVRVEPKEFSSWKIVNFEITKEQENIYNKRCLFQQTPELMVRAGKYTKLMKNGNVVMSNTEMEIKSNMIAYETAKGKVLIAGLGMGMILDAILSKPDVTHIRVIEIDQDLIENVGVLYKDNPKVEIVHADVLEYKPTEGEFYNYIWFDIWTDISEKNVFDMQKMVEIFSNHYEKASFWSIDLFPENYLNHEEISIIHSIKSSKGYCG